MAKFLKTCLVIGVICIGVGIAASAAGVSLGGLTELKEQVLKGEWSFGRDDIFEGDSSAERGSNIGFDIDGIWDVDPFFELEEQEFFDKDESVSDGSIKQENSFQTAGLTGTNIKSAGVTVKFMVHNGSEILVYASKTGKYQNYVRDNELSIIVSGESKKDIGEGLVEILIPQGLCDSAQLDLDIEAGASVIELGTLVLDEVEMEVNAGTVSWEGLRAGDLSIEMAAGAVNGAGTYISRTTDIEMHAGSVTLSGGLGTETDLEIMAGKISMTLDNSFTDFNYDISCAGGSVTVGEETMQGLGKDFKQNNNAPNHMDIECSAGAVEIQFE